MKLAALFIMLLVLIVGCLSDHTGSMRTRVTEYNCANGMTAHATYLTAAPDKYSVLIRIDRSHYDLSMVPSASGEKYTDGQFTWWTKGSTAFLEVDGRLVLRDCLATSASMKGITAD